MRVYQPGKMSCRWVVVAAVTLALLAPLSRADDNVTWLTGPALRKKLDQPVGIGWSQTPLRDGLQGLARTHQVAIILDRRIDPGQPLDLNLRDVPLRQALEVVVQNRNLGYCLLDSVIYFGPPAVSQKLRTLAAMKKEEMSPLPAARRLELGRTKPCKWSDLAMPRDLVSQVGKEAKLQIQGLEQIPHDLWTGADLPPLSVIDRLLLICSQFDLCFTWEDAGKAVRLAPWPKEISVERSYPGGKEPAKFAEQLAAVLTDSTIQVVNDKVMVRGLLEQHEMIDAARTASKPAVAAEADISKTKIEQFKVQNKSLKVLLDTFRQQLRLDIRVDADQLKRSGKSLDMLLSLDLKNVTVDELLQQTLSPAGLTFQRKDRVVEVRVAEGK